MKKDWEKPELIVLLRSHPEEGVLTTCKTLTGDSGPAKENYNKCAHDVFLCGECASEASS
ncbi:MAG: hypothetical protein JW843_10275 [Candidatus Aminicenantes bacterium]|nr:hypothetical protein [Candidatus Aminicenantes bacterium]